jgi:hypothetical protein
MEKIIISFTKGRGKKTLATPISKNARRMPHHHLNIFIIRISLFDPAYYDLTVNMKKIIFLRLLKNAPACAEASAGGQMQVELRKIVM